MKNNQLMIYGAYGYAGELMVREAVAQEAPPYYRRARCRKAETYRYGTEPRMPGFRCTEYRKQFTGYKRTTQLCGAVFRHGGAAGASMSCATDPLPRHYGRDRHLPEMPCAG